MILLFVSTLFSRQILLVVADDFDATKGKLSCIEDGRVVCEGIDVVLGRKGLGWGRGVVEIPHERGEPVKKEGDGRAPAGIFVLMYIFGYDELSTKYKMPYLHATKELKCVDDVTSPLYNRIVHSPKDAKSFEEMRREDGLYRLGVVIGHNQEAKKGAGSCVFLHVWRGRESATAGCTAMSYEDIQKIAAWLDVAKEPLLIQIPKKYLPKVKKMKLLE